MSRPRFLLVHGLAANGVPRRRWPGPGVPDVLPPAGGGWISWRLLAGNNYELGRGGTCYADTAECLSALRELKEHAPTDGAMTVRGGRWWWHVEVAGGPLAVSARGYQRQRECGYNLAQFLAEAPKAGLPEPTAAPPAGRRSREPHGDNRDPSPHDAGPDARDPRVAAGVTGPAGAR